MASVCNGYIYGVDGSISGIKVETQNADTGPQYVAEAKDACGRTKAVKLGKHTGTCTVSGYFFSALPTINSKVVISGRSFFIDKVSKSQSNTDFQKCEMTGKFWEGIDTIGQTANC